MKNLCLTMAVLAMLVSVASAQAGIANSAHDARQWGLGINQICIPCHTPHAANYTAAALWNHALTTQTFTMYGTTIRGTASDAAPNKESKLCLSCHDGVTAVDAYGGATGTTNITNYGASKSVGTDLRNDHPISILYDYNVTNHGTHGLEDPAAMFAGSSNQPWLYSGKVECATCHDVHNKAGNADFLRVANTGSALCLACHDK